MTPTTPAERSGEPVKESFDRTSVRNRIVAGARHHFFTYGFRQVTMDDLAAELGMSKKTLYKYFSSKRSLIEAALLNKIGEASSDLDRIISASSSDFPYALRQLLECLQRHTGEVQPPFVRDVRREAPELFKLVEGRRREMIHNYFGRLLDEGRRAGIIRTDIPATMITEILLAAVDQIINPQRLEELGLTAREGFTAIIAVIFKGVITDAGRSHL